MVVVRVRTGGLMRCCLASIDEAMIKATEMPKEGDTMNCEFCNSRDGGMIYRDGAWEWDQVKSEVGRRDTGTEDRRG